MIKTQDVLNKKFSTTMFGYNKAEVDEFLNLIIDRMEDDEKSRAKHVEEFKAIQEKYNELKQMETELKNTLVVAQQHAENIRIEATREIEAEKHQLKVELENYKQQIMSEAQAWVLEQKNQIDAEREAINRERTDMESRRDTIRREVTEAYRLLGGDISAGAAEKGIPKAVVEHFQTDMETGPEATGPVPGLAESAIEESPLNTAVQPVPAVAGEPGAGVSPMQPLPQMAPPIQPSITSPAQQPIAPSIQPPAAQPVRYPASFGLNIPEPPAMPPVPPVQQPATQPSVLESAVPPVQQQPIAPPPGSIHGDAQAPSGSDALKMVEDALARVQQDQQPVPAPKPARITLDHPDEENKPPQPSTARAPWISGLINMKESNDL